MASAAELCVLVLVGVASASPLNNNFTGVIKKSGLQSNDEQANLLQALEASVDGIKDERYVRLLVEDFEKVARELGYIYNDFEHLSANKDFQKFVISQNATTRKTFVDAINGVLKSIEWSSDLREEDFSKALETGLSSNYEFVKILHLSETKQLNEHVHKILKKIDNEYKYTLIKAVHNFVSTYLPKIAIRYQNTSTSAPTTSQRSDEKFTVSSTTTDYTSTHSAYSHSTTSSSTVAADSRTPVRSPTSTSTVAASVSPVTVAVFPTSTSAPTSAESKNNNSVRATSVSLGLVSVSVAVLLLQ